MHLNSYTQTFKLATQEAILKLFPNPEVEQTICSCVTSIIAKESAICTVSAVWAQWKQIPTLMQFC